MAYVIEEGFRVFVPLVDGWLKRSLKVELLEDNNALRRLHDALMKKAGPTLAPPESRPLLPTMPEDVEGDESILILIEDEWQIVAGNTRPIVSLDERGVPVYSA